MAIYIEISPLLWEVTQVNKRKRLFKKRLKITLPYNLLRRQCIRLASWYSEQYQISHAKYVGPSTSYKANTWRGSHCITEAIDIQIESTIQKFGRGQVPHSSWFPDSVSYNQICFWYRQLKLVEWLFRSLKLCDTKTHVLRQDAEYWFKHLLNCMHIKSTWYQARAPILLRECSNKSAWAPGFRTLYISFRAFKGSLKTHRENVETTVSNELSGNGNAWTSPAQAKTFHESP